MPVTLLAAAFIGGMVRAVLGLRKHGAREQVALTIASSGIIGTMAAAAFFYVSPVALTNTAALAAAALAGYVGTDVVEALYKIRAARGGRLA